jgi:hypothetical protein
MIKRRFTDALLRAIIKLLPVDFYIIKEKNDEKINRSSVACMPADGIEHRSYLV